MYSSKVNIILKSMPEEHAKMFPGSLDLLRREFGRDWYKKINLDNLHMESTYSCVIGQLRKKGEWDEYGSYGDFCSYLEEKLELDESAVQSMMVLFWGNHENEKLWRAYIQDRLEKDVRK